MQDLLDQLAGMTWNEAHNHMMELNLPLAMRVDLTAKADKLRTLRSMASKRIKLIEYQHAEMWHRLLTPLKYELSNAKVGLELKSYDEAPERHTAFSEYVILLEKLLAGLLKIKHDEEVKLATGEKPRTPAEIATERGLPGRGAHWTQWISDKTRTRIEILFDAIPTKAKRPKPFAYRVPPDLFKQEQAALQMRTLNEIDLVRQEMQLIRDLENPTADQTFRLRELEDEEYAIKRALWHMTFGMYNEPVPSTWQGLKLDLQDKPKLHKRARLTLEQIVSTWDEDEPRIWTQEIEDSLRAALGMYVERKKTIKRRGRYKK